MFLQPGPMSSLSLLFQVGQQWKQNQQSGAVDWKYAHHVLARAPAQAPGQSAGATTHQGQGQQLAQGWEMAVPNLEPIIGSRDCGRTGPASNHDVVEMLSRVIPLLGTPFMVNRFHANGGLKETNQQSRGFPIEYFQQNSWLPGCVAGPGEAQRPLSASIDWHPDETRFTSTVASRGCSSEALSRIRQLKLLNSNNTCYLNAFVLSWLHAIRQVARNMLPLGPGLRLGVMFCTQESPCMYMCSHLGKVSVKDGHRQRDAGDMREHWVAAGWPQVVSGRWEARIAEGCWLKSDTLPQPHPPSIWIYRIWNSSF